MNATRVAVYSRRTDDCAEIVLGLKGVKLTRISHTQSTARPQSSALTVLRSVGLLDVLSKYDCGGLGRKPCQDSAFGLSLRPGMRNAG